MDHLHMPLLYQNHLNLSQLKNQEHANQILCCICQKFIPKKQMLSVSQCHYFCFDCHKNNILFTLFNSPAQDQGRYIKCPIDQCCHHLTNQSKLYKRLPKLLKSRLNDFYQGKKYQPFTSEEISTFILAEKDYRSSIAIALQQSNSVRISLDNYRIFVRQNDQMVGRELQNQKLLLILNEKQEINQLKQQEQIKDLYKQILHERQKIENMQKQNNSCSVFRVIFYPFVLTFGLSISILILTFGILLGGIFGIIAIIGYIGPIVFLVIVIVQAINGNMQQMYYSIILMVGSLLFFLINRITNKNTLKIIKLIFNISKKIMKQSTLFICNDK